MTRRVLSRIAMLLMGRRPLMLLAGLILLAGLAAVLVLPSRTASSESAYVACVGVGDPADFGVCVPAPYPERLPLPEPDDIPLPV